VCGVDDVVVDFLKRGIDRQHHERQEIIDHAEDDGAGRIDQMLCRKPEGRKEGIDDAGFFQQGLPGVGAQQEVHPHRKDEDEDDEAVGLFLERGQDHAERVGQKKAYAGCGQRQKNRQQKSLAVGRVQDGGDIFKSEGAGAVGQSVPDDQKERDDDEHRSPEIIGSAEPGKRIFSLTHRWPRLPRLPIPVSS